MMACSGLGVAVQGHVCELNNIGASTTAEQFACTWAARQGKWGHVPHGMHALLGSSESLGKGGEHGQYQPMHLCPLSGPGMILNANVSAREGRTPGHQC